MDIKRFQEHADYLGKRVRALSGEIAMKRDGRPADIEGALDLLRHAFETVTEAYAELCKKGAK